VAGVAEVAGVDGVDGVDGGGASADLFQGYMSYTRRLLIAIRKRPAANPRSGLPA